MDKNLTKVDFSHLIVLGLGIMLGALIVFFIQGNKIKFLNVKYIRLEADLKELSLLIEKAEKRKDQIEIKDLVAYSKNIKERIARFDAK